MLFQTFDGIDSCGDRLTSEIQQKVKQYPSLNKISLLGHSMGGLLVRYAAGAQRIFPTNDVTHMCTCV